jgi:hypothetical protein
LLLGGLSAEGSYLTDVLPGFLLLGVGGGLAASGVMITALSGASNEDAGAISGLTTAAHELSVALVLPILSAVAAGTLGAAQREGIPIDSGLLAASFADAFQAAAVLAFGGALLAVLALRRTDATATPATYMIH